MHFRFVGLAVHDVEVHGIVLRDTDYIHLYNSMVKTFEAGKPARRKQALRQSQITAFFVAQRVTRSRVRPRRQRPRPAIRLPVPVPADDDILTVDSGDSSVILLD